MLKNEKCLKLWDLARKSKKMVRHFCFQLIFDLFLILFAENWKMLKIMRFCEKIEKNDTTFLFSTYFRLIFNFFAEKWKMLKIMRFGEKIEKNDTTFCFSTYFQLIFIFFLPKNEKCLKSWDLARKSKKMLRHFVFRLIFDLFLFFFCRKMKTA